MNIPEKKKNKKNEKNRRLDPRETVYPEQPALPDGGEDKRGPVDINQNEDGVVKGTIKGRDL